MSVGQVTSAAYGPPGSRQIVLQGEWVGDVDSRRWRLAEGEVGHLFITVARSASELASMHCTVPPAAGQTAFQIVGASASAPTHWQATLDCDPWLGERPEPQTYLIRVLAAGVLDDHSLAVYDWEAWLKVNPPAQE
jgi:hypothetical protein